MTPRTALVLLAPHVDAVLRDLRTRYFRNLDRRMPTHVTMVFPFRSPIDDATLDMVGEVAAGLSPIDASFREPGRFRRDVVWLHPEPDDEFERASDAVLSAFPDCAPYGGAHRSRTLHLTVASRLRGHEADRLLDELGTVLPLTDRIDRLSLMSETGAGWAETRSWPLPVPQATRFHKGFPSDSTQIRCGNPRGWKSDRREERAPNDRFE